MIVKAYLDAFQFGKARLIEIPDADADDCKSDSALLDLAFYYGQNDFQPRDGCCSVSVGDRIELETGMFLVLAAGFEKLVSDLQA